MSGNPPPYMRFMRGAFADNASAEQAVHAARADEIAVGIDTLGWDGRSLDALQRALKASGGADHLSNRALRDALRPMCVAGQRAGKRAEEMVILLKTLWPTLAQSPDASSRRDDATFERVVSIGIDEYYRGAPQARE